MALPRWMKWALGSLAGLVGSFLALAVAGLWLLSSYVAPDVTIGEPLPPVELANLEGAPIDLQGYGGRVVVLDFWSSW